MSPTFIYNQIAIEELQFIDAGSSRWFFDVAYARVFIYHTEIQLKGGIHWLSSLENLARHGQYLGVCPNLEPPLYQTFGQAWPTFGVCPMPLLI